MGDVVLGIRCCRAWYPHFPFPQGAGFDLLRRRAKLAYALRRDNLRVVPKSISRREEISGTGQSPSLRHAPHVIAFFNYLADYSSVPVYGESEGGENEKAKTPWYLFAVLLRVRLHQQLGILPRLTLAQAWNTAIGYGGWINAAMIEATGGKIDILTPELKAAFAEANIPLG